MPGAPHAGAWRTKRSILTTNYEPKSPSRRTGDQSDEKLVIVRGALKPCLSLFLFLLRLQFSLFPGISLRGGTLESCPYIVLHVARPRSLAEPCGPGLAYARPCGQAGRLSAPTPKPPTRAEDLSFLKSARRHNAAELAQRDGVWLIYDRWNYMPEKRVGMEKWGEFITSLLNKNPAEIAA